jgi:hypothetical protein
LYGVGIGTGLGGGGAAMAIFGVPVPGLSWVVTIGVGLVFSGIALWRIGTRNRRVPEAIRR